MHNLLQVNLNWSMEQNWVDLHPKTTIFRPYFMLGDTLLGEKKISWKIGLKFDVKEQNGKNSELDF